MMINYSPGIKTKQVANRTRAPRPPALIHQSSRRGRRLGTLGWLGLILGATFLGHGNNGPLWMNIATTIAGLLLAVLGLIAVLRSRGNLTRVLPSLSGIPEDQRIVLFLRAFSDDAGFGRMAGFSFRRMGEWMTNPTHDEFRTEEEQVARAVDRFGRMVALGQPDDQLPRPGAERSYAADDSWQGEVLSALDRAELVLLTAGPGENLSWEVEQVLRRNDPTHLVILISHKKRQYADFAGTMAPLFPGGLPNLPKTKIRHWILRGRFVHAAIWFDQDWNPHLEMLDGRFPLIGSLRRTQRAIPRALRELYRREGLTVRRKRPIPPRRPWSVKASVALFAYSWITVIVLFFRFFQIILQLLSEALPITVGGLYSIPTILTLPAVFFFAFWTYRVWVGGSISIVTLQTTGLALSFAALALSLSIATNVNGYATIVALLLTLPPLCVLALPPLLLTRHDAREWIQACA